MASKNFKSPERRRLALIINNHRYARSENALNPSIETGFRLANILKGLNFKVEQYKDLEKEMMKTMKTFINKIQDGDLVLFYFFGQSYAVDKRNYLLPVSDDRIESEIDVEDLGADAQQIITRILDNRPSCVAIIIFDCCRPYRLENGSRSQGLAAMTSHPGAFIQYSCGAGETTTSDLFGQHLLRHIAEENIDIKDVFQRISDGVYRGSDGRHKPLSIDGLNRHGPIYLNEVYRPPVCPLQDIPPSKMEVEMKKQAELREHFDQFPRIEDVLEEYNPDVIRARDFTKRILEQEPSGVASEGVPACHILARFFQDHGQECLFFDSTKGMRLHDASANLVDLFTDERPFVLKLNSSEGLGDPNYLRGEDFDLKLVYTLNRAIEENKSHPVMDDVRERLARTHGVEPNKILLQKAYLGSVSIPYLVDEQRSETVRKLPQIPKRLKQTFPEYCCAKIHPLLFHTGLDISEFDSRGDKDFTAMATTFLVGPPGRERVYQQPRGWERFGLKVLGKFGDDAWLHPFRNPGNWYRAYHGTANARAQHFNPHDPLDNQKKAPVIAMRSIHRGGFLPATNTRYGPGVYCSPSPEFVETGYAATVNLETETGNKTYKLMLQVAAHPDDARIATENIWVVREPAHIRAYAMLIKTMDQRQPSRTQINRAQRQPRNRNFS